LAHSRLDASAFFSRSSCASNSGLQRPEAVPLARPLAGFDVFGALGDRLAQRHKRLGERFDALDLELMRDLVEVDSDLGELFQLSRRQLRVLVDAGAHLAVLAERCQRGRRDRVDGVRTDQLLDVVGVRVTGVLR